jgi:hypothetical protein
MRLDLASKKGRRNGKPTKRNAKKSVRREVDLD